MNPEDQPVIVEIKDKRFEITIDQLNHLNYKKNDDGLYELNQDGEAYKLISFNRINGECIVSINGQIKTIKIIREIDVMIEKMGLNVSHSKKLKAVVAPMPGLVAGIKIEPNQKVEKGDALIILEAMKMENVISAPHDAIIKSIKVTVGQAVERGFPLIEFE